GKRSRRPPPPPMLAHSRTDSPEPALPGRAPGRTGPVAIASEHLDDKLLIDPKPREERANEMPAPGRPRRAADDPGIRLPYRSAWAPRLPAGQGQPVTCERRADTLSPPGCGL